MGACEKSGSETRPLGSFVQWRATFGACGEGGSETRAPGQFYSMASSHECLRGRGITCRFGSYRLWLRLASMAK